MVIIIAIVINEASWRKRLDARLPPLGSRVRVSVTPCGFRGERNGILLGFSRGFPLSQISFHHFYTLISSILFHFISSVPAMMRRAWSASTLAIHRLSTWGFHRISSFVPALSQIWVEEIYYYYRCHHHHHHHHHLHGRLARGLKWRAYDVGEAKEELENELWRRWSDVKVW